MKKVIKSPKKIRIFLAIALGVGWTLASGAFPNQGLLAQEPTMFQRFRTENVWRQVYEQLPDLPKENNYVNTETGEVDPNNTLVGRLIRFHIYTQGRPPLYRFDWKLTFADYLGVTGAIDEETYPSANRLRPNPAERDVAVIRSLNRVQREALIQALVDAFAAQLRPSQSRPVPSPAAPGSGQNAPAAQPKGLTF